MSDVQSVGADAVVEAVGFGDGAVFVEQEGKGNWMFGEKGRGLEDTFAFLGSDEDPLGPRLDDLFFEGLDLSHAFGAVGSPSATQKLDYHRTTRQHGGEGKVAVEVRRAQYERGRGRASLKRIRVIYHLERRIKQGKRPNNGECSREPKKVRERKREVEGHLQIFTAVDRLFTARGGEKCSDIRTGDSD